MYRLVVFLAVTLTASADETMDTETCVSALKSQLHCCKEPLFKKGSIIEDDIKECKTIPSGPESCDRELCFATKIGFAKDDGTIIIDKLQKHFEDTLSDYKDVLAALRENCLEGGYKKFGQSDHCDLKKMKKCVLWHYGFRCPDFSKEGSCQDFKDIAPKCLEISP